MFPPGKIIPKSSEYKYVNKFIHKDLSVLWLGYVRGLKKFKYCKTEREAAKWVDLVLIEAKKEPVNILKRK